MRRGEILWLLARYELHGFGLTSPRFESLRARYTRLPRAIRLPARA